MTPFFRKCWWFLVATAGCVALGFCAYLVDCLAQHLSLAKNAELARRSVSRVAEAAESYVAEHEAWPTSWRDLESAPAAFRGDFLPEGGWKEIRAYAHVDFGATLDHLARRDLDNFEAIRPIGSEPTNYRDCFAPLLETIRRIQGEDNRSIESARVKKAKKGEEDTHPFKVKRTILEPLDSNVNMGILVAVSNHGGCHARLCSPPDCR